MKKYSWVCLILALIIALGAIGCTDDTVHGDGGTLTEDSDKGTLEQMPIEPNDVQWTQYSETLSSGDGKIYSVSFVLPIKWEIATNDGNGKIIYDSENKKRFGERVLQTNIDFDAFNENKLSDTSGNGIVKNPDSPYEGTTESGMEYIGYQVSVFPSAEKFSFLFKYSDTLYLYYSVWMQSGDEYAEFFENTVLPIINSVTILEMSTEPEPFDAESFFAHIPAEWSQRLFWHQIRGTADYIYFCNHRGANSTLDGYKKDPPKQFSVYHVNSQNQNIIGHIAAEISSDITYDTVCPVVVMDGAGSMECEFIVQLTDGDKRFYVSFDNFDWGESQDHLTFTCRGILSEERVNELKTLYPEEFLKAEQYYWHYTLSDFKNENPGDSLVYEGYTVEYECESPYAGTFDFHIHLPQLNSDSIYAQRWNYLYQEYDIKFGEQLRKTALGTNTDYYAHITYDTVTTGDVLTIYIVKSHGILASGASTLDYDIYHYDMKKERFISTDEFLAYYAEGQFAGYTVSDIVKFMNENVFTTDEMGSPYPITEENILGVIPSVFGNGKFDVVYMGYNLEGYHATRTLLSPYPTYTSDAVYTYRLTYHDYLTCHDKELYGSPVGYRLLLSKRVDGQCDVGYYVDCLFTEDIAERPESYPESVYGEYYTPVGEDEYGNMCMFIDHETDKGHLTTVIPFDMTDSAQDYYRGVLRGYFDYERILDGNYQVNKDIAAKVAEILDACRKDNDPNELLPASKTEYTPFPVGFVRDNPDAIEIGEILRNASVDENGIIDFSIDIGDG